MRLCEGERAQAKEIERQTPCWTDLQKQKAWHEQNSPIVSFFSLFSHYSLIWNKTFHSENHVKNMKYGKHRLRSHKIKKLQILKKENSKAGFIRQNNEKLTPQSSWTVNNSDENIPSHWEALEDPWFPPLNKCSLKTKPCHGEHTPFTLSSRTKEELLLAFPALIFQDNTFKTKRLLTMSDHSYVF